MPKTKKAGGASSTCNVGNGKRRASSADGYNDCNFPQRYKLKCAVKETHGHPIYCAAFSRHVHTSGNGSATVACFATCGGGFATIYEVEASSASGNNGKKVGNGSRNDGRDEQTRPSLSARQVYCDVDDGETFYTCAFGGRGVGSPVGYSAVGIVNTKQINGSDGIIYFGEDKWHDRRHLNNSRHDDSKWPAKRPRQSEEDHTYVTNSYIGASTAAARTPPFILPYSDTQNGPPLLCLAGTRGIIKVIDTCRRTLFMTLSGHGNDITDLKFSPTNEWLLLSSSKDETIRLWNVQRGVNVAVFTGHNGHRGQVLSVSWHLSGRKFASCGMDNMVKLWKVLDDDNDDDDDNNCNGEEKEGPKKERMCNVVEEALRKSLNVTPDNYLAGKDLETQQATRFSAVFQQFPYFSTNKAHTNYVDCVQFVGDLILSKSVSNKVVLWRPITDNGEEYTTTQTGPHEIQFLREFNLENCNSWYIRFDSPSPLHHLLALGNQVGEVKVWKVGGDDKDDSGFHPRQKYYCNLSTSSIGGRIVSKDPSTVRMVAFNPHGCQLVAVKDDSTVWMWDAL